jgi:hypothetical protein
VLSRESNLFHKKWKNLRLGGLPRSVVHQPKSFQEVQSYKDKQSWMKAMKEEMNSLHKNNTYELVELLKGKI